MSSLTGSERAKLERLLDMSSGYVANFSDGSIGIFFGDEVGVDIHSIKYQSAGTSKAKKLREFWRIEADHLVGKSIKALVQHMRESVYAESKSDLIVECDIIAKRLLSGKVNLESLKETAIVFDSAYLSEQIARMEKSIETDPSLAIGTAKELIETCCKTILAERGAAISGTPDIPALTKETLKQLRLVPEGVQDSVRGSDLIKRILQNLGTIGNGLSELRGLYGTGHGKHAHSQGLTARHARLAVGTASTLVTFLFETHKETA